MTAGGVKGDNRPTRRRGPGMTLPYWEVDNLCWTCGVQYREADMIEREADEDSEPQCTYCKEEEDND